MQRSLTVRAALVLAAVVVALPALAQVGEGPPADSQRAEKLREDLRQMIVQARDRVFPALVNVKVITVNYWNGKEHKGAGVGSGTIISPEGHVLTNYHVVRNGRKFTCTLADKREVPAELVGEDPLTDLAVIKLDAIALEERDAPLTVASLGDSDRLEVGDTVMAMGSPWALSRSVTLGIVSNTERVLAGDEDDMEAMHFDPDQRTGLFNRWIQHDAAINPGNSGGPLVNLHGEVVGVNTRGNIRGGDMGFAIPANIARSVVEELIDAGEVTRSWVGLSFKPIRKSGLEAGVLVNSVVEKGPAARAGLEAGDVIVRIDGSPLTVWFPEEVPPLLKRLADLPVNTEVQVRYRRDGEEHDVAVVTERMLRDRGDEAAFRGWGLTAMGITEKMARERRLTSSEGVLVSSVGSGSPAQNAEPPIAGGDVIRAVGGEPVADLESFIARYRSIMDAPEPPESILLEFDRQGRNHLTMLEPQEDRDFDPPRELAKAWVGVAVQPVVADLAEMLGPAAGQGFRITRVYPRTEAAGTELRVGDIILELDGQRLRPRGWQDAGLFHRQVRRLDIDGEATLAILRDGERRELTVPLERTRITPAEARRDRNRDFELTVREVTFFDRDENRWDSDVHGVLVSEVGPAGWAALGGLRPGDLIQRIDEQFIEDLDGYRQVMEQITADQPERVVFVVLRGVRTHFHYVEPDWQPEVSED